MALDSPAAGQSMNEAVPLLGAKLLPPTPGPFHLLRPRLHARLAAGLEGRATVVLAGPGYGKTSLVARFLQETDGDFVWYWLDGSDRDPWMFFQYLIRGMKQHVPEFGDRTEGLWRDLRSRTGEAEQLADTFISDAEESLGGRLVLVLDEVQHLEGNALCVRALRRLLAYLPGALHLVLVGRSLPELGVKALRAEDAVHPIEGEDLLFTLPETNTLLGETFGLRLQPGTVEKVHSRTRGWATALQLLRQTARLDSETPDLPENLFARTEPEIFDYFSEEVLASETAEARDFLLASSLPAVVDPEICSSVLRNSDVRGTLAGLLRRKLFISPLESAGEYYAYDPLFRDFLRRKLRSERGAGGIRELDLRFGKALARRGDFVQALAHWIAAEEVRATADLLNRQGKSLLRAGMLDAVREAALFVAGRGVRSASIEDLLGEACRLAGDHAAAVGHFERALAKGARGGQSLLGAARTGALQGLAYSLLKTGDAARAAETAERARAEAEDDDPAQLARILNTLSIIRYRQRRDTEALSGWQEALVRARQAGDDHLVRMIAHNLGLPHAASGDFQRASECFRILTGPENPRLGPEEGAAYLNLARIETLRGEYTRAASLLGDAREIALKLRLQALSADVFEAEGTLFRETGDLEAARERYARARAVFTELGQMDLLDSLGEEEAILAARRGGFDEAERQAARLMGRRRAAGDLEGTASALLALGEVRARAGANLPRAGEALAEASELFASLGRAYQECVSLLWLASVRHGEGNGEEAGKAAEEALRLAVKFDYRALVLRFAGTDAAFARFLGSLAAAPAYVREISPRGQPPPVSLGSMGEGGADLTVRLLGSTEVFRDAVRTIPPRAWKVRRAFEIFCFLASARDRRATRDRIVDALWGDTRLAVIEKNFHPTISFLRGALNYGHNVPKNFILFERGAYRLNPAYRYEIDTEQFEAKIRAARRSAASDDAGAALSAYEAALAIYRGPFLEEDYGEWTEAPRAHFEALYLAALEEAARIHLRKGDRDAGLSLLRKVVERDPLNEEISARFMTALGEGGNRAGIEKEFARLRQALAEDLSSEPLAETRRAYEKAISSGSQKAPR